MGFLSELLLVGGLLCLLWAWLGSSRIVHQVRYRSSLDPRDFGLSMEPIPLRTRDAVSLSAGLIRQSRASGILLMLHGFGASKEDLFDLARAFYLQGLFHLFLLDFRAHGRSEGRVISFGLNESLDVQAAIDWITGDPSLKNLPIGCYGLSMGGAIALKAAAEDSRIAALVTDSAYASLSDTVARIQWLTYHIPRIPLGQMALWGTELRLRCRVGSLAPVKFIERIAPRPVFIIHGAKDISIPSTEGQALYDAAQEPKELWLIPDAEHVAGYYKGPEEYVRRVTQFFQDAFRRAPKISARS